VIFIIVGIVGIIFSLFGVFYGLQPYQTYLFAHNAMHIGGFVSESLQFPWFIPMHYTFTVILCVAGLITSLAYLVRKSKWWFSALLAILYFLATPRGAFSWSGLLFLAPGIFYTLMICPRSKRERLYSEKENTVLAHTDSSTQ
jgi:hypothetical protein